MRISYEERQAPAFSLKKEKSIDNQRPNEIEMELENVLAGNETINQDKSFELEDEIREHGASMESTQKFLHDGKRSIHPDDIPRYESGKKKTDPIVSNIGSIFQVENISASTTKRVSKPDEDSNLLPSPPGSREKGHRGLNNIVAIKCNFQPTQKFLDQLMDQSEDLKYIVDNLKTRLIDVKFKGKTYENKETLRQEYILKTSTAPKKLKKT